MDLQKDLDRLHQWSSLWQMKFNADKCHLMRFTIRQNITDAKYHLGGQPLSSVSEYPYLGVLLSTDTLWQKHLTQVSNKATRMLGLLQRNLRSSSRKIREMAYCALVRQKLEYCSTVWSPYFDKDIKKLEAIQRRAARFVLQRYYRRDSVTSMIDHLGWKSLEWRRNAASLAMLYKIQHNLVAINPALYISPMTPSITRSYHPSKLEELSARTKRYSYAFFPRSVILWNSIPTAIHAAPSVDAFKDGVAAELR